ncbi:MAG: hypothetical protein KAI57_01445 [Candidatus Pacebacteria bacterium]|nr:hypothetical protein [Candidatus Paceibacterota bacterium]
MTTLKIKPAWLDNDTTGKFIVFAIIATVSFFIAVALMNAQELAILIMTSAVTILSNQGIQTMIILLLFAALATAISNNIKKES